MQSTRWPQQKAGEASVNSKVAEIQACKQVVGEQGTSGPRSVAFSTGPAGQPEGEQPTSRQPCDCDAAVSKFGAQEHTRDQIGDGDQRNARCDLDRRGQQ